jgi:hypothetical protein
MMDFEQKQFEVDNFHRFIPKNFSKQNLREEAISKNEIE